MLRNLTTNEEYTFTYEDWLSKLYGPKNNLVCEMPAIVDGEEMVEITTYTVNIKTSDILGQSRPYTPYTPYIHTQKTVRYGVA